MVLIVTIDKVKEGSRIGEGEVAIVASLIDADVSNKVGDGDEDRFLTTFRATTGGKGATL